jgi:hypothetical protein
VQLRVDEIATDAGLERPRRTLPMSWWSTPFQVGGGDTCVRNTSKNAEKLPGDALDSVHLCLSNAANHLIRNACCDGMTIANCKQYR